MSALDELKNTGFSQRGNIGRAIVLLWEGGNCSGYEYLAENAAAELAALRAKLEEAREIIEMLDMAANRDESESVKSRAREWLK